MAVIENSKLAIVGAGSVGTALAYASLIRGSAREITLYDLNRSKVEAEVADLAHGTPLSGSSTVDGGADVGVVSGANVVVITAGAKQDPGQTRMDLAATNVRILRDLMPQLIEQAPNAVYVIVSNPCDVLAVAAWKFSGLPKSRVFASGTVLDSARLRRSLATQLRVSPASIHALIAGEHGDSQFPLWSSARIGPVPILEWMRDSGSGITRAELDAVADQVKNAAYSIIEGKGATNYAIGLAGSRIVEAILRDEGIVLPVSSVLDDYHGVSGVALSVPTLVDASGIERVLDIHFDDDEAQKFAASAAAVQAELEQLDIPAG